VAVVVAVIGVVPRRQGDGGPWRDGEVAGLKPAVAKPAVAKPAGEVKPVLVAAPGDPAITGA